MPSVSTACRAKVSPLITVFGLVAAHAAAVYGQGMSAGDTPGAPAFVERNFKDSLYAAGGPIVTDTKNGKTITAVVVEGNRTVSEHNILSRMQCREGRVFDPDQFHRDLAELYRTGYFQHIEPYFTETETEVQIRLRFAEKPTVENIFFHGNRVESDAKLRKYCGIERGDAISPQQVQAARSRIVDYYRSKGFNNASVQITSGDKPGDRIVVYRISEGELERFDDIVFVGNQAFSSELLKTKLQSKDSNRFIPNLTSYAFNRVSHDGIAADAQTLVEYYRGLGYFDARIDYFTAYDTKHGKFLTTTFVIAEGEPYDVNEVRVEGNRYYQAEQLTAFFKLKPGDRFHLGKKNTDEKFVRDAYGAVGFIFCDVVASITTLPNNKVDVVYSIDEGDVYRASEINVHINGDVSYTKERVVLLNLGNLRPGEIIDAVELENAERRLKYSTIFENNPAQGEVPKIVVNPVGDLLPEDL